MGSTPPDGAEAGNELGSVSVIADLRARIRRTESDGPPRPRTRRSPVETGGPDGDSTDVPDYESAARTICLRLLTRSARTRADLATALARKGIPPEVAESVLNRYTEVGLIDDGGYAHTYVRTKHRERGLGRRSLALELKRKGIADELATAALAEIGPEDERVRATELVNKKLAAALGAGPEAARRRLVGMLARRGYSPELAFDIVEAALAKAGVEDAAG